jgi:radical SAM superfamily enzyme YgiQ (UPF0313 family)
MPENTLIIATPVLMPNTLPYGPAVVSGILTQANYNSTVWDLNIDLHQKYKSQWNVIVDLLGNRAYRPSPEQKISITGILSTIRQMVRKKLKEVQPDSVLLSVFSSQSLDLVIPLTSMIKEFLPDCYLIVGGRGLDNTERLTRQEYGDFYSNYLPADCWYLGDAENNLVDVLKNKTKGVFRSPPVASQDLENMPPASWKGYDFSLYQGYTAQSLRMPITGSKGCVRDCTFCDVASSWPKFVYRNGEDIGRELVDAYRTHGIRRFEFTDNLVNGSIKNFRAMNNYIAQHEPDVFDYIGYAICRPRNEFPESDFRLARIAGASTFRVGIESGSERVRFDMKKKFSNADISWFAENCHDNGIKQTWLMFVGYPTETEEDFQASIDLLKKHSHLTGSGLISVFLSLPMMLTSGSAFMRKYGEEYGLAHNASDPWSDFFWTSKLHQDNTFEVRANRWRRFVEAINQYGYANNSTRQAEKFLEIEGIEKIYRENYKNGKKVIPISTDTVYVNKETYI